MAQSINPDHASIAGAGFEWFGSRAMALHIA